MTFEQGLITGVAVLWSSLVIVCGLLWGEAKACKRDRTALRKRVEALEREAGLTAGQVEMYEGCPQRFCPFHPREPRGGEQHA